jgi:hypothetical protein
MREQHAFGERLERPGAARIWKVRRAERGQRAGIGAELARRAGSAVLRVLEVTGEIVVTKRRHDKNRRVKRDAYPA